jgi:mono/diheme cytochrome c family protein
MKPMTSIRKTITILFTGSVLLVGCSRKNATTAQQELIRDSTAHVDSSNLAVVPKAVELLSYEQRQGKDLYTKYCAICHGTEGKGDGFNAFNLEPRPRDFTDLKYMNALSDARLVETIMRGGRGVNRSPLMPTWGGRLKNDEAAYVLSFVRSLGKSNE